LVFMVPLIKVSSNSESKKRWIMLFSRKGRISNNAVTLRDQICIATLGARPACHFGVTAPRDLHVTTAELRKTVYANRIEVRSRNKAGKL